MTSVTFKILLLVMVMISFTITQDISKPKVKSEDDKTFENIKQSVDYIAKLLKDDRDNIAQFMLDIKAKNLAYEESLRKSSDEIKKKAEELSNKELGIRSKQEELEAKR